MRKWTAYFTILTDVEIFVSYEKSDVIPLVMPLWRPDYIRLGSLKTKIFKVHKICEYLNKQENIVFVPSKLLQISRKSNQNKLTLSNATKLLKIFKEFFIEFHRLFFSEFP